MDAVEYIKTLRRICKEHEHDPSCMDCPAVHICGVKIYHATQEEMGEAMKAIEAWKEGHPAKTRQDEFMKMFPNVFIINGCIVISPCIIDTSIYKTCIHSCEECSRKYWMKEIE